MFLLKWKSGIKIKNNLFKRKHGNWCRKNITLNRIACLLPFRVNLNQFINTNKADPCYLDWDCIEPGTSLVAQTIKASACNAGDLGSIPGLWRSPGEGNGNPFQCSCLENPMDRGACQATVQGVTKSQTRLSDFTSFLYWTYRSRWLNL